MRSSTTKHSSYVKGTPKYDRLTSTTSSDREQPNERLTSLSTDKPKSKSPKTQQNKNPRTPPPRRHLTQDGPQPLDLVIEEFLRMKEGVRAHKTLLNYRERMKLFYAYIQEYREDVENIEDVTPRVIKDYMDYMSERGNNKGTVFNFFRVLRTLLNWYERYTDYEYRSPLFKVDTPIVKVKPLPGIPVEDIKKMVQDCNGRNVVRDKAILQFLLDTGVRAFELLAVNLEDVDMVTGQVIVRHGKGDKERTVFFGTKTRTALRNYLKTRGEYKRPFDPLFMSDRDGRLTLSGLRQIVRRRAEAVGLPEPGLHDFRRAFCVTMYRNGVDLVTLSRLMGHSTLEVLKRYIKEDVADLARAHAQASPVDTKLR